MAALGCPSNMATVVSAVEPMQEYVQVVVGQNGDPSQVVVVHGGGGELLRPVQELSQEILQSLSQNDTVFYVQPDGSLVPGGSLEDVQSGVRLVTGGGLADQPEVRLQSEGQEVETGHPEMNLVTGSQMEELVQQPGGSLVTGGDMMEALQPDIQLGNGGQVVEAVTSVDHGLEAIQAAVNLVTRGQTVEAAPSGMVIGGHLEEAVIPGVSQVNRDHVHLGMDLSTGDLDTAHPDMETALNLTKEAAQCTDGGQPQEIATPEISMVTAGAPEMAKDVMQSQSSVGGTTNCGLSMMKDAAQQLKSVAHHVALSEGDSVTRILNHKQLKSIHYQVPSLQTKKRADPVVLNLSTVHMKNTAPNLLGAQVMQIKTLRESGQPLVVKSSALESPIQILVRSPQLSAVKPRTDTNENTMESFEEHRSCVAHQQNGDHGQKKGHKRKKSIKIKTRSGRISRPPKHKAKDYKFLKVGDLIQGSTTDSEDYSELSTDEEEKGLKEKAPCDLPPYTVKNTLFQCQTCEKSYMGKGGLSRHYRLYPSHGQMEPPFVSDAKKNGEAVVGGHSLPSEPKKPTPRPRKRLLEDPLNPDDSSLPNLARDGLQFVPASTSCRGRRQMTGRRFGRPRKILAIASSEQNALTAKEMIQQCEDADLNEYVAPCFSERLSVYDFMLVKVKQEYPGKPLFPHLYKELEKLHAAVRILAQEYLSTEQTLEVADCKVAASLGISSEKIVEVSPIVTPSATEEKKIQVEEENDCSVEDLMPPSKRLKPDEPETVSSTVDTTFADTPVDHEAEQMTVLASVDGESSCGKDTSSDIAVYCHTTSQTNVREDDAENVHMITNPEAIPHDMEQNLMEASPSVLDTSLQELGGSGQISSERPEDPSRDEIQTHIIQEDTDTEEIYIGSHNDHLLYAQTSANDPNLIPAAPTTTDDNSQSKGFQGVDTLIPPDMIADAQCAQSFAFHDEHDLVFVHSAEETIMDETVVVYDTMESPANTQLNTMVALIERK